MRKKKNPEEDSFDDLMEIDEDSDIPVHEPYVKEKKFKRISDERVFKG